MMSDWTDDAGENVYKLDIGPLGDRLGTGSGDRFARGDNKTGTLTGDGSRRDPPGGTGLFPRALDQSEKEKNWRGPVPVHSAPPVIRDRLADVVRWCGNVLGVDPGIGGGLDLMWGVSVRYLRGLVPGEWGCCRGAMGPGGFRAGEWLTAGFHGEASMGRVFAADGGCGQWRGGWRWAMFVGRRCGKSKRNSRDDRIRNVPRSGAVFSLRETGNGA